MPRVVPSDGDSCVLPRELKLYLSEQSLLTGDIVKLAEIALAMKKTMNTSILLRF